MSAEGLAERIASEVAARVGSGDDIALLVVRLAGVPRAMDIEIPGDPAAARRLAPAPAHVARAARPRAEERDDAVLSVSEACNNAIEHAYNGGTGTIRLKLEHRADELGIAIEDRGDWRPPTPTRARARHPADARGDERWPRSSTRRARDARPAHRRLS